MNQTKADQSRLRAFKAAALGSVVYFSTFGFPLGGGVLSFGAADAIMLLAKPFIMGLLFAMVYGRYKIKFVYLSSLVLTGVGMLIRYIIEYGEVSNTRNFTPANILIYLGLIPVLITLAYVFNGKYSMGQKR